MKNRGIGALTPLRPSPEIKPVRVAQILDELPESAPSESVGILLSNLAADDTAILGDEITVDAHQGIDARIIISGYNRYSTTHTVPC
jgi:hypothetical protein